MSERVREVKPRELIDIKNLKVTIELKICKEMI